MLIFQSLKCNFKFRKLSIFNTFNQSFKARGAKQAQDLLLNLVVPAFFKGEHH